MPLPGHSGESSFLLLLVDSSGFWGTGAGASLRRSTAKGRPRQAVAEGHAGDASRRTSAESSAGGRRGCRRAREINWEQGVRVDVLKALKYPFAAYRLRDVHSENYVIRPALQAGGIVKEAFEAGGTEKEAGPLGRRAGPGQGLEAGGRTQDQLQTQPGKLVYKTFVRVVGGSEVSEERKLKGKGGFEEKCQGRCEETTAMTPNGWQEGILLKPSSSGSARKRGAFVGGTWVTEAEPEVYSDLDLASPQGRISMVFNVWLSSHTWLFRLVSSQLIAARFLDQRQLVSFRPGPVFSTAAYLEIGSDCVVLSEDAQSRVSFRRLYSRREVECRCAARASLKGFWTGGDRVVFAPCREKPVQRGELRTDGHQPPVRSVERSPGSHELTTETIVTGRRRRNTQRVQGLHCSPLLTECHFPPGIILESVTQALDFNPLCCDTSIVPLLLLDDEGPMSSTSPEAAGLSAIMKL
ncbi:hypothetical protein EYF80_027271 [Liparis tanakae]|uniref:Uncharacterized protein n=1 Tax=Liparis tanakae TaxID=230148 RepID=A0A4Z2H9B4_9TELE|nr:hypothetical protein EYF80_027271 [Liparis tanakae]